MSTTETITATNANPLAAFHEVARAILDPRRFPDTVDMLPVVRKAITAKPGPADGYADVARIVGAHRSAYSRWARAAEPSSQSKVIAQFTEGWRGAGLPEITVAVDGAGMWTATATAVPAAAVVS